jgi:hypothetical protein
MVRVTIELVSSKGADHNRTLGVVEIANDGTGTGEFGNYLYRISHGGVFFGRRKGWWKKGRVMRFGRRLSPYRLLSRVLRMAGEV